MSRSVISLMFVAGISLVGPDLASAAQPKSKPAQASKPGQPAKPAGGIYKWVDENGVTQYGQSIPPQYQDQAAQEMNRRGLTVRHIDPASTPEERRALEEKARLEQEERKRLHAQRRRDRALMATYSSAQEIDEARDRNLTLPTQALRELEPRLNKAQTRLSKLEAQRNEMSTSGRPIPDYIEEDIAAQAREVEALRAEMDRQAAQIATIRTRFEADRQRFIELTQVAPR